MAVMRKAGLLLLFSISASAFTQPAIHPVRLHHSKGGAARVMAATATTTRTMMHQQHHSSSGMITPSQVMMSLAALQEEEQSTHHHGVKRRVVKLGKKAIELVRKAGTSGLIVLTALLLTAGAPLMASATTLADVSLSASNTLQGITAGLAASGFLQAFSLVFVSEIGDKTFFIAGLLAMKTSRLISFTGSMGALTVMTIISVIIGQIFHAIPSSLAGGVKFDQWVAALAFAYFGFKTLYEAYEMPDGDVSGIEEEKAEAEKAVEGSQAAQAQKSAWGNLFQIFSLVFAAEFGDRSFLSTIALAAAQNPVSVAVGAVAAHGTATGIAVASGAFLSKYLSEKIISYIGGSLFVLFAITTAFRIF